MTSVHSFFDKTEYSWFLEVPLLISTVDKNQHAIKKHAGFYFLFQLSPVLIRIPNIIDKAEADEGAEEDLGREVCKAA